jgi:hypothetical protein
MEKREIHVTLAAIQHRDFMVKVRCEDSNASRKIRSWTARYLKGELD